MTRTVRPFLIVLGVLLATIARGEEQEPPTATIPRASGHLLPTPGERAGRGSSASRGNGWWMAPAGLVAALAMFGGAVMVARRFSPTIGLESSTKALRVIGRAALSPRHTVHMVRAGGRTLLIGTGPQGAPSLIAELDGIEPTPNRAGATS